MIYKAVIFDLDGVICHTDEYHYRAWLKIADELGINFNEKINNLLRGVGRMQSLDIILELSDKELSDEEKKLYAEEKNSYYIKLLDDLTPADVEPDVFETLNMIRSRGIKMAIGSSSKNAKRILKKVGLIDFFDAISDGTNIIRTKPHPEVFLKASNYLGIKPKECIVVEDAQSGVEAAIAANMDCAAIGGAAGYSLASYSLKNLSDLLQYVL